MIPVSHKKNTGDSAPCITRDMTVMEVITLCPGAADILAEYGLHCTSCVLSAVETLEDGCRGHGQMTEEEIDALVEDVNEQLRSQPMPEQMIIITEAAAKAVQEIAKEEEKEGQGLAVIVDSSGGFCMEFQEEKEEGSSVFFCESVPEMQFYASPLTLYRIGGSTIDFREGRFKLDLVEDECSKGDGCCGANTCKHK